MAKKRAKKAKRELTSENLSYYQHKMLINKIRQVSQWWPYKNKAKNKAKVSVQIGFFKNGKPKFKVKYKCEACGDVHDKIEMDHIIPVVDTLAGFVDWSSYINNMLCTDENYSALCHTCHQVKTQRENLMRNKA